MMLSDETLMAYVDGELPDVEAADRLGRCA